MHHYFALIDELGAVIDGDDFVAVGMGKLAFDDITIITEFFTDRRAYEGAEAVTGHAVFVAKVVQGFQDGVVADRLVWLYGLGKT